MDFSTEDEVKRRLAEYRSFVDQSGDALDYAWATYQRLAELGDRVRSAAGLRSQILEITDKDIIGTPVFGRRR